MIKEAKIMILKALAAHPKLIVFGIMLAMTLTVATMGGIQIQDAYAGCYHVLVADSSP
jgi:hypothetical protein